jgi:pimeloyl-ACP methyl ester carboxylesterase
MPYLATPHALLYYDIFSPDITAPTTQQPNQPQQAFQTVLLIRGFAGTPTSDFAAQIPQLCTHYTVLAPHLHGYGRSSHRTRYSTTYYREDVRDLVALLDALQLPQVLVLGFSDGAIVALLLAALYPERVAALAVLGAQASINAQDVAAIRYWLLDTPLSEEWQAQLAQLHGDPYWRALPQMYVQVQEELVAAGGILITDEELADIGCPTLVMHGTRDRIVPVEYARILHERIAESQLSLFDAGHAAQVKRERELTEVMMNFFHDSQIDS